MEQHQEALEKLCRICGQRCVKWPKSKINYKGLNKFTHRTKIKITFNIDVDNDVDVIHPSGICLACYAACSKASSTRPRVGWTEHTTSSTDCKACSLLKATIGKRRRNAAATGWESRRKRKEQERKNAVVDEACNILLSSEITSPTRKLQRVTTAVVKTLMTEDKLVELPTGGSVS